MVRVLAFLLIVAGASGCMTAPDDLDCRDPALQRLVGQPLTALVDLDPAQSFKVDRSYIDGTVTADYFPERVRVDLDRRDIIRSLTCG